MAGQNIVLDLVFLVGLLCTVSATESSILDELRFEIQELKEATTTKLMKVENEFKLYREHSEQFRPVKDVIILTNPFAEKPAFSTALSQHATNLGNYETLVFDNAYTNDLGAYSTTSGVFTVPINGTYFFTATVMSHLGDYIETEICLNGHTMVAMYSRDSQHEQGTNSVVLALTVGDKVWVRHKGTQGSQAYGNSKGWSTFSGFMISFGSV